MNFKKEINCNETLILSTKGIKSMEIEGFFQFLAVWSTR